MIPSEKVVPNASIRRAAPSPFPEITTEPQYTQEGAGAHFPSLRRRLQIVWCFSFIIFSSTTYVIFFPFGICLFRLFLHFFTVGPRTPSNHLAYPQGYIFPSLRTAAI